MKPKFEINKPQFTKIVFCFQNCSDLLWEKNCSSDQEKRLRLKVENLKKVSDH